MKFSKQKYGNYFVLRLNCQTENFFILSSLSNFQDFSIQNYAKIDREGIIVALDQRFVIYPGGAGVDEGAGVEDRIKGCWCTRGSRYRRQTLYRRSLFYTGNRSRQSMAAGSGRER